MSKAGRGRRSPEARLARRKQRQQMGSGVFRYLTPQQAASSEFHPDAPNPESTKVSETRRKK